MLRDLIRELFVSVTGCLIVLLVLVLAAVLALAALAFIWWFIRGYYA